MLVLQFGVDNKYTDFFVGVGLSVVPCGDAILP